MQSGEKPVPLKLVIKEITGNQHCLKRTRHNLTEVE